MVNLLMELIIIKSVLIGESSDEQKACTRPKQWSYKVQYWWTENNQTFLLLSLQDLRGSEQILMEVSKFSCGKYTVAIGHFG